jgi:hypothetical protein
MLGLPPVRINPKSVNLSFDHWNNTKELKGDGMVKLREVKLGVSLSEENVLQSDEMKRGYALDVRELV